ncbi:MAG TPA: hypothetical protein PK129_05515 [Cellvibrionaceae bacterium]|nr:hypothetical protein [Cellvibrionaceae bacterium]
MNNVKRLGLAVAIAAASASVNASTLVFDFSGTADITFDASYYTPATASVYGAFLSLVPQSGSFSGLVVLPSFENYLTGTHAISLNTSGLHLSLSNGFVGALEGTSGAGGVVPDDTQEGDSGFLLLSEGQVAGFEWHAGGSNPIVSRFNAGLPSALPTRLGGVDVVSGPATFSYHIGDVYFAANRSGTADITMVPEVDSSAMLLAGLGIVGAIVRRRRLDK